MRLFASLGPPPSVRHLRAAGSIAYCSPTLPEVFSPVSAYLALLRQAPALLGLGVLLSLGSSFGQTFFISIFGAEIRSAFDLTHAGFGGIYSFATLTSAFCLIWVGRLVDVLSLRAVMLLTMSGLALACLTLASAEALLTLWLAMFGLRLCGQGMMSHIAITNAVRSFREERGKAVSISSQGISLGEILFPLIGIWALMWDWRSAWYLFAAAIMIIFAPTALTLLRKANVRTPSQDRHATGAPDVSPDWTRNEVLKDPRFYLLMPGGLTSAFITTGIFFHQIHIMSLKGWSPAMFAASLTAYALAATSSSLTIGALVDRLTARRVLPFVVLPMTGAMLCLLGGSAWMLWPMMALLGCSSAGLSVTLAALWAELYGTRHQGAIRAVVTSVMVCGSALSPIAFGWVFDLEIPLNALLYALIAYTLVGAWLFRLAMQRSVPAAVILPSDP